MTCFKEKKELDSRNKKIADVPSTAYGRENEIQGSIHIHSCSKSFLYPPPLGYYELPLNT